MQMGCEKDVFGDVAGNSLSERTLALIMLEARAGSLRSISRPTDLSERRLARVRAGCGAFRIGYGLAQITEVSGETTSY